MLALVGQQLATQATDLRTSVVDGISKIQDWAKTGPLKLSDDQIQTWIDNAKESIQIERHVADHPRRRGRQRR